MASTTVELVRSIYAARERGKFGSVEWLDTEIEFVLADGPDPASSTGLAGMAETFRDQRALVEFDALTRHLLPLLRYRVDGLLPTEEGADLADLCAIEAREDEADRLPDR
jgi:hypothetical protein